ncbi:hypothetical protein SRHO_G00070110 [Serrasalmus rhombeus]
MDRGDSAHERRWRGATERHCGGSREAIKTRSNMNDFSSDETEKGPPLHTHSLREFEQLFLYVARQLASHGFLLHSVSEAATLERQCGAGLSGQSAVPYRSVDILTSCSYPSSTERGHNG